MITETPSEGGDSLMDDNVPAAICDIGCERDINEDRYAALDAPAGKAWLVCDGMGGALGGELAAQLAIDAMRRTLASGDFDSAEEALRFAIEEANRIIVLRRQNPAFSGMGTTVVGLLINGEEIAIGHAGDSRAYLVRGREIQQLSVDHTYVQDLVDRGEITAEDAMSHPQSHVLTRCLGAEPRLQVDTQVYWIWENQLGQKNDKILLCSDGLYSLITDDEIVDIVAEMTPNDACVQLVEMARERGGYDNITVVIVPVEGQIKEESRERPAKVEKQNKSSRKPLNKKQKLLLFGGVLMLGLAAAVAIAFLK